MEYHDEYAGHRCRREFCFLFLSFSCLHRAFKLSISCKMLPEDPVATRCCCLEPGTRGREAGLCKVRGTVLQASLISAEGAPHPSHSQLQTTCPPCALFWWNKVAGSLEAPSCAPSRIPVMGEASAHRGRGGSGSGRKSGAESDGVQQAVPYIQSHAETLLVELGDLGGAQGSGY